MCAWVNLPEWWPDKASRGNDIIAVRVAHLPTVSNCWLCGG